MKIAFICTEKLPVPPVAGGAVQIYIDGVLPYLAQKHDITVFCIEHPSLLSEEAQSNIKYVRVPGKNKNEYLRNVRKRLDDSYNLIHVFNRPLWVLPIARDLPYTHMSLSLHNEMFLTDKISSAEAVTCIERVDFINTVSRFIAKGVVDLYPNAMGKMNVVYSGVDNNSFKPVWTEEGIRNRLTLKEKYNIKEYKVVLFVGRLSVKKGVHTLFKAMKQIMESNPKVALVIIGSKWFGENTSDEYTRHLEELSKELKGPIVFTGFLPPSEIPEHYNMADIFVCPSQWNEPLARVHYEAMAAGLPIITTNRGGNAEVISPYQNGLVIDDYKNPDAFAACINYFLENPAKAMEIGRNGRRLAEEKYGWGRVAEDLIRPAANIQYLMKPVQIPPINIIKETPVREYKDTDIDSNFFTIDF